MVNSHFLLKWPPQNKFFLYQRIGGIMKIIVAGGLASTNRDALAIKEQTSKSMAIYMKEKN